MAKPLQLLAFALTGLIAGLTGSLFDPRSLSFAAPTMAHIEAFPYRSFVPGLLTGLLLGALWRARWGQFWSGFAGFIGSLGRGADVIVLGVICVAVLMFI